MFQSFTITAVTTPTFQTASFPSTPIVLTSVIVPLCPSYDPTLVAVFRGTVNNSDSPRELPPQPPRLERPLEPTLNVLKAALFSLPGPTGLNREGVRADFGVDMSSRLPMSLLPPSFP